MVGRGVGLTKKRMIQVSRTVRLAGRRENQDMFVRGVDILRTVGECGCGL